MSVPELPSAVVARLAQALSEAIAATRDANPAASEYEQADAIGASRVTLRNLADGYSDRHKRTAANPRLDTLVALSRFYGMRIVIDAGATEVVAVSIDEDALRHSARAISRRTRE